MVSERPPSTHRYRLLGGLAVDDDRGPLDLGAPKQRAVLSVLVLELDRVVPVARLIDMLWDDESDKAVSSLQAYISRLRSTLEPDRPPRDPATILLSQAPGYRLSGERSQVDLYRFEDEVTAGLEALEAGDPARAGATLDAALRLWTGPVLPELAGQPFVIPVAARAGRSRLAALEGSAQARLERGDHRGAASLLEAEAAAHPARERMHGLLALALYRSERQADALALVDRCRRALRDSAGLDPGPELKRLEADLLNQSPGLDWQPAAATTATTAPAPPVEASRGSTRANLHRTSPSTLVGRHRELGVLSDALAAAAVGHGGAVLLLGEPGIGKTRLAEWAVESAVEHGFLTAWARGPERRSVPPFWAVTQLTRQLGHGGIDTAPVDALLDTAPPGAHQDTAPPGTHQDTAPPGAPSNDGHERFRIYRAMTATLADADRPVLLVIDDLHWADADSLRLIEHLAADLSTMPVLLVATTRPLTDESPDVLVDCLAELARVPGSAQLALPGLGIDDVESWLAARTDIVVPHAVAELVHERAGGNPLFVKEVTELLASEGRLADEDAAKEARAIPPGVQFVVRRRVSRLPPASQQTLGVAAVLGVRFTLATVAVANGTDPAATLTALAPALDAGLLVESDGELAFSHALVADALAGEVNAARRAAIHADAARSLADAAGPAMGAEAALIAHHAMEGILAGTGELAIETSKRAAQVATARYAFEDSAAHWANAASVLSRQRPGDRAARIDALTEQATALMRADKVVSAKQPILAAIEAAEAAGSVDAMVRAGELLTHSRVWANQAYGVVDEAVVDALTRTLLALPDDVDPRRRALLLGAVSSELVFADRPRHTRACDAALAAARAAGDPEVLARLLSITMVPNRPDELDQRRDRANEIIEIHQTHGLPPDLVYAGHHHIAECHLEVAAFDQTQHHIDQSAQALESMPGTHLHAQHHWFAATVAIETGRYESADALITRAYELHRRGRRYDADVLYLASRCGLALDLGGFEMILDFATQAAGTTGYRRAVPESIAFGALEVGQTDRARSLVAPFGPDSGFPDDYTTLFCATAALHVRVELGDADGARSAARCLGPYAHRWANAGTIPSSMGIVGLALARYDAMTGDTDRARDRFAEALALSERSGAVAWRARGLVHHGRFLLDIGDTAAGQQSLAEARRLARTHRLPYVERRLDALVP